MFRVTSLVVLVLVLAACGGPQQPEVVVYTSVDQVYSEPLLRSFERLSGIKALPVFDVEASKTTGLVQRLIAEAPKPRCDVFWNGEFAQTLLLEARGVLAPYSPPAVDEIPADLVSRRACWTAVGGRLRVFLANTGRLGLEDVPQSIGALLEPETDLTRFGLANPLFGTSATHAAALHLVAGHDETIAFFRGLSERGAQVLHGNSVVRDRVVSGQLDFGLTDSDDACQAISKGAPVAIVIPDQQDTGTLFIPGTVAMMAGAPHPREAAELIDFLTSAKVEKQLIDSGCVQLSVRPDGARAPCLGGAPIQRLQRDLESIHELLEPSQRELAEIFLQ